MLASLFLVLVLLTLTIALQIKMGGYIITVVSGTLVGITLLHHIVFLMMARSERKAEAEDPLNAPLACPACLTHMASLIATFLLFMVWFGLSWVPLGLSVFFLHVKDDPELQGAKPVVVELGILHGVQGLLGYVECFVCLGIFCILVHHRRRQNRMAHELAKEEA